MKILSVCLQGKQNLARIVQVLDTQDPRINLLPLSINRDFQIEDVKEKTFPIN